MALGDRLGGIVDLFKQFKDLLPIALEIIECLKDLDPPVRARTIEIVVNRLTDDAGERGEITARIERLVA